MNRRKIIVIFSILFGCAFCILFAHVMNAGWDAERDRNLLFSFAALTVSLVVGGVSLSYLSGSKS